MCWKLATLAFVECASLLLDLTNRMIDHQECMIFWVSSQVVTGVAAEVETSAEEAEVTMADTVGAAEVVAPCAAETMATEVPVLTAVWYLHKY